MKKKKSLRSITRLEAEQESKRRAQEQEERLDAIGQENEKKGAKWAKEDFDEREKEEEVARIQAYEILSRLKKNQTKYNRFLVDITKHHVNQENIEKKYKPDIRANKQGVVLSIPGTKFTGAFKSCMIPRYDYWACKMLAVKMGNTVSHLKGEREKTESGIYLPDELDVKNIKQIQSAD